MIDNHEKLFIIAVIPLYLVRNQQANTKLVSNIALQTSIMLYQKRKQGKRSQITPMSLVHTEVEMFIKKTHAYV